MKQARDILTEVLSERQSANKAYSLRAFARDLGVSPQQLSNVMSGRRGLGNQLANQVVKHLDLDQNQKELFLESLKAEFSRSRVQRVVSKSKLTEIQTNSVSKNLELDLFKTISNWHHFTLIELIKISKNKSRKANWYAEKLGITENEVNLSFGRLERLELITKNNIGWTVNQDVVIADKGIPTESVKNYHKQILEKAMQALTFQTSEERYGNSSTMPIKVKDVALAKKMIQKFKSDFNKAVTDPVNGEEIYGLSMQFFRLTNPIKSREV